MTEKWTDKWSEVHYRETQAQIARLAMQKSYRRYEWWQDFNRTRDEWQEEQDKPEV